MKGIGYDRMNHNQTILVYSPTLHSRSDLQKLFNYLIKLTPGTIYLDYNYFISSIIIIFLLWAYQASYQC